MEFNVINSFVLTVGKNGSENHLLIVEVKYTQGEDYCNLKTFEFDVGISDSEINEAIKTYGSQLKNEDTLIRRVQLSGVIE